MPSSLVVILVPLMVCEACAVDSEACDGEACDGGAWTFMLVRCSGALVVRRCRPRLNSE